MSRTNYEAVSDYVGHCSTPSATRPRHLPGIEASSLPQLSPGTNPLRKAQVPLAVEIFDSLPTVYRKFRPSCAGPAIDRRNRSNQKLSHIRKNPGACLVRAWCGPGAGLVRAWCGLQDRGVVRQTHYPRQPADVEASKVGILPRKKIQSSPSPPPGEDVLAETCAEEGLVRLAHQHAVTPVRGCCVKHTNPRITRTMKLLRTAGMPLQDRSRGAGLAPALLSTALR